MTTSELQANVRERDGIAVIDLTGDLNSSAEEALNDAYAKAAGSDPDSIVLNFERAEYINSTGIALIVAGLPERTPKPMGQVMAALKAKHGEALDSRAASARVKAALS